MAIRAGFMNLDDWNFHLPPECIARYPSDQRDGSRLLVVRENTVEHCTFSDLPSLLHREDALVVNNTAVMPARLRGARASGARLEILALAPGPGIVPCLIRNARRLKEGEVIHIGNRKATVVSRLPDGIFAVDLGDALSLMRSSGELPLPPYLGRTEEPIDRERYQTVFAGPVGAAAAPTAGLHFTPKTLHDLSQRGVDVLPITLHVGIGTFRPLREEDIARGELHPEPWVVPEQTALRLRDVRQRGGRIIAVGTTSARTLASATPVGATSPLPGAGTTRIFLHPGKQIRSVDGLLTNFHLPRSSLLMLVAALIGRERLFEIYSTAIAEGYRFYSYGDAMLIL